MEGTGVSGHVASERLWPNTIPDWCGVQASVSLFDTKLELFRRITDRPHEVTIDDRVENGVIYCVIDVTILVIVHPSRLHREKPGVDTLPCPVQCSRICGLGS